MSPAGSLRSSRPALRYLPVFLLAALLLAGLGLTACSSSSGGGPQPPPTPAFTATGKPGGTLRVVGSVHDVPLDPALARSDAALLVNRLVLRQLYAYRPGDTTPTPDLALGPPQLSNDRMTATITLRGNARWNVPGGRGVTSGDVLRGLKRLCAPSVLAPERGYLEQVVVGYAEFCSKASRVRAGAKQPVDLDTVDVPGLQAVGDSQVQISLRRPAADLEQILSLPALTPLPFEIRKGFDDPLQMVGNGPYRFTDPEAGESYRLSRNANWDPGSDPVRAALVDRVSFRGGLPADEVQKRLETNGADLSWDAEAPTDLLAKPVPKDSWSLARVDDRDLAVLAVGTRGPAAGTLATGPARAALAACLDRPALLGAFGGAERAAVSDALLTPEYLDAPAGEQPEQPSTAPPATPSGSATPGAGTAAPRTGTAASSGPRSSPSATRPPIPAPNSDAASKPLPVAQCRTTLGKAGLPDGTDLTLLAVDAPRERAAADQLRDRFAALGLSVSQRLVPVDRFATATAAGGWDLALEVLRPDYVGTRAVLTPLLDPRWPGPDRIGSNRRSPAWLTEMAAGLAEQNPSQVAARGLDLATTITSDGAVMPLIRVATVRLTGANVGQIPPVVSLGNADPTNVSLGVTRPSESPSSGSAPS